MILRWLHQPTAEGSQYPGLLSSGSWIANKPVLTDLTVKTVLLVKIFLHWRWPVLTGRLRKTSPSYGKLGRLVLDGFWKNQLQCYSSLNSVPISLNMLHNHPVVPKRKSQFLLVNLTPTICLKCVTVDSFLKDILLVQFFGGNLLRTKQCADDRPILRFRHFGGAMGGSWPSGCSVPPNCFHCTVRGKMKGRVGRKLTPLKFIWKLWGKELELVRSSCLSLSLTFPSFPPASSIFAVVCWLSLCISTAVPSLLLFSGILFTQFSLNQHPQVVITLFCFVFKYCSSQH